MFNPSNRVHRHFERPPPRFLRRTEFPPTTPSQARHDIIFTRFLPRSPENLPSIWRVCVRDKNIQTACCTCMLGRLATAFQKVSERASTGSLQDGVPVLDTGNTKTILQLCPHFHRAPDAIAPPTPSQARQSQLVPPSLSSLGPPLKPCFVRNFTSCSEPFRKSDNAPFL